MFGEGGGVLFTCSKYRGGGYWVFHMICDWGDFFVCDA